MYRKIFLIITFISIAQLSHAQAFTYYPFNSVFSIATNPNKVVWADFRFQMNSYFSSLSTEVSPMFNLNKSERAKFYVGAGIKANFLNALNPDASKAITLRRLLFECGSPSFTSSKVTKITNCF
ncbi:MAG: hypothetical protein U5M51_11850 [Emticicia sp.]|nr:hypothetical protein [Emticicia sp.]